MEMIIFCGVPATGKSTFYKKNFADSHVRINRDMLKNRKREKAILLACLETHTKVVIDNCNVKKSERSYYINIAKKYKYKVILYSFLLPDYSENVSRNEHRINSVPIIAIKAKRKEYQEPSSDEGFDEIYKI